MGGRSKTILFGGATVVGLGILALLGWALRVPFLAGLGSDRIPMAPSTALLFALYGVATLLRARQPSGLLARRIGAAVGCAGSLIALLLLVLSSLGVRPAVERLGFSGSGSVSGAPVGHMSPVTAACFLLVGLSFLSSLPSPASPSWRSRAARFSAAALLSAAGVLLLAYLYGSPLFYGGSFIPPAATTSLAFAALGMALLALSGRGQVVEESDATQVTPSALLLVFALLGAGIVTVGGLYLRSQARLYRARVEGQLSALADLKASALAQWRAERLGDASHFQGNAAFSALVVRVLDDPRDAHANEQLREWLSTTRTSYGYDTVALLDSAGTQRLAVPEGRAPSSSVIVEHVPAVLRSRNVTVEDFHRNEHDARIYLTLLVPIFETSGGGRALGVVALRIDPETYVYPLLGRWPESATTAETLLVRRDGSDALILNPLRLRKGAALAARIPLASTRAAATRAVLGQEGVMESEDDRGVAVLAALRTVPGSPWSLVALVEAAEVNAPLAERLGVMVLLVGAMLAAAAAGVTAVARGQRIREIRGRLEVERERAWLHDVVARSLDEIYVFDPGTLRFRFANRGACRNLGYTLDELTGLTPLDLEPERTAEAFHSILQTLREPDRPVRTFRAVHRRKDGSRYPVEVHLQLVDAGGGPVFLAVVDDITERLRAETRIRQLNRVYAVLSDVNQAIVHIREPGALFDEVCRLAVETGGFRAVWIDLVDPATKSLRPAAHAVAADGHQVAEDVPVTRGLAPEALRQGVRIVCNDIEHDPPASEWRDAALAHGYRSSVAFPLAASGETPGVLTLFSGEPGAFDAQELSLLDEMAADLSFAMEMRRVESLQARLTLAIEQVPVSVIITDPDGRIEYVNPSFTSITGYTAAEALGRNPRMLKSGKTAPATYQELWATIKSGSNWHGRIVNRRKGGDFYTQELTIAPVRDRAGKVTHFVAIGQDVTERERSERALQSAEALYHGLFEQSPFGVLLVDAGTGKTLEANEAAHRQLGYTREELVALRITDYEAVETPEQTRDRIQRVLSVGSDDFETVHRTKHGELRNVHVRVRTVQLAERLAFHCIYDDVTDRKRAESERRASEERYRALAQSANESIVTADSAGTIVGWNPAAETSFGYTADEIIGRPLALLIPERYLEGHLAGMERMRSGGERRLIGKTVEMTGLRKGGREFPIELSLARWETAEGWFVTGMIRDITERHRAQQELERSEAFLKSLFETAADAILVMSSGRFLSCNPASEVLFGCRREEIIGRSPTDLSPLEQPDGRSSKEKAAEYLGAALAGVPQRFAWTHLRADGTPFDAEVILNRVDLPGAVHLQAVVRDVTERNRAERALKESERRLTYALDATVGGVWDWNLETGEVFFSPQWIASLGYSPEEVPATIEFWKGIVHPDDLPRVLDSVEAHLAGRTAQHQCEDRVLTKSGGYRHNLDRARVVERSVDGRPLRMVGTDTDITERRRGEEMLRQSQKVEAVGRLAGGIAHDFNNMIAVILGYGEMAQAELGPSHPVRARVDEMIQAAARAADLTRQLLTFSRKQVIEPRAVDLNGIVADARKMLGRLIGEDVDVVVRTTPGLGTVMADPGQIVQIILNLAVNARDAMPEGGTLTIETGNVEFDEDLAAAHPPAAPGRYVLLAVSDTGIGMDEETKSRIFEPFFTTKAQGEGTGLGLATVYGIVKQSEGFIWVYSEKGRGTTFKVYLPRVDRKATASGVSVAPGETPRGDETILVAEDSEPLREMVRQTLEGLGYTVLLASSGEEALALALAHEGPIPLLLTDVVMPRMGGGELGRQLPAVRPETRVLYMSGYTDGVISQHGILKEGVRLLQKPFTSRTLAQAVRELLDEKPTEGRTPSAASALVVEDDPQVRKLTTLTLERAGYGVESAGSVAAACEALGSGRDYVAILCDMTLPDGSGEDVVRYLQGARPELRGRVIVLTGGTTAAVRERLTALGITSVLQKPVSRDELLAGVAAVAGR